MSMKEEIRILDFGDAEAFKNIRIGSLVDDPLSWLSSLEEEKDLPPYAFSNKLKFAIAPPIFGYYGYFEDGKLQAYAQLSNSFWNKKKHIINLYDVCVSKEVRRKSVGTKLMKYIIDKAKKTPGIEQIHLWVTSTNKGAITFYESLGFKMAASTKNTVKENDGNYQDEILYTLNL